LKTPSVISKWSGIGQMRLLLDAAGFRIPERYAEYSASIAGKGKNEWLETIMRHGRDFVRAGGDDRLYDPRIGELNQVKIEHVMNPIYRDVYATQCREWKKEEMVSDQSLEIDWSPKKMHLRVIVQRIAQREGFRITKKGYIVPLPNKLRLDVEIDVGRPGSTIAQIVMLNRVISEENEWLMWLPWDCVIPGMNYYTTGNDPTELSWGAKALVSIGKFFAVSLGA